MKINLNNINKKYKNKFKFNIYKLKINYILKGESKEYFSYFYCLDNTYFFNKYDYDSSIKNNYNIWNMYHRYESSKFFSKIYQKKKVLRCLKIYGLRKFLRLPKKNYFFVLEKFDEYFFLQEKNNKKIFLDNFLNNVKKIKWFFNTFKLNYKFNKRKFKKFAYSWIFKWFTLPKILFKYNYLNFSYYRVLKNKLVDFFYFLIETYYTINFIYKKRYNFLQYIVNVDTSHIDFKSAYTKVKHYTIYLGNLLYIVLYNFKQKKSMYYTSIKYADNLIGYFNILILQKPKYLAALHKLQQKIFFIKFIGIFTLMCVENQVYKNKKVQNKKFLIRRNRFSVFFTQVKIKFLMNFFFNFLQKLQLLDSGYNFFFSLFNWEYPFFFKIICYCIYLKKYKYKYINNRVFSYIPIVSFFFKSMTKCGLKYKVFLFFYSFLFLLKIKIKSIYVNVGLNRCYTSINRIKKNKKINIGLYFLKLLHKLSPKFKFLTTNKAGKTYKIPVTIKSYTQSYSLLLRWVVKNAKLRLEKGFALKFIAELFDLKNKRGKTFTAIETYKLLVKDTLSHLTYYDPWWKKKKRLMNFKKWPLLYRKYYSFGKLLMSKQQRLSLLKKRQSSLLVKFRRFRRLSRFWRKNINFFSDKKYVQWGFYSFTNNHVFYKYGLKYYSNKVKQKQLFFKNFFKNINTKNIYNGGKYYKNKYSRYTYNTYKNNNVYNRKIYKKKKNNYYYVKKK